MAVERGEERVGARRGPRGFGHAGGCTPRAIRA